MEYKDDTVSVVLPLRGRHEYSTLSSSPTGPGLKRCRADDEDDFSTTDSDEESSDLEDAILESDEDSSDSLDDTAVPPRPEQPPSEAVKGLAHRVVDWALPALARWKASARYIRPPEHRVSPRKRSRRSAKQPRRSVFIETQDPSDPSTILILRVDGYYRLACPIIAWDPTRYAACGTRPALRSLSALVRHLRRFHPRPAYCPICGRDFGSGGAAAAACDAHIVTRSCTPRYVAPADVPRGVAREQLRRIVEADDPARREDERWRRVYAAVFPGAPRPRRAAAYLSEGLPLAVSMARDYWEARGPGLVEQDHAGEGMGGRELFAGEDVFSVVCELDGRELILRVTADVLGDGVCVLKDCDAEERGW